MWNVTVGPFHRCSHRGCQQALAVSYSAATRGTEAPTLSVRLRTIAVMTGAQTPFPKSLILSRRDP